VQTSQANKTKAKKVAKAAMPAAKQTKPKAIKKVPAKGKKK
jgi:hypothetical protein